MPYLETTGQQSVTENSLWATNVSSATKYVIYPSLTLNFHNSHRGLTMFLIIFLHLPYSPSSTASCGVLSMMRFLYICIISNNYCTLVRPRTWGAPQQGMDLLLRIHKRIVVCLLNWAAQDLLIHHRIETKTKPKIIFYLALVHNSPLLVCHVVYKAFMMYKSWAKKQLFDQENSTMSSTISI